MSMIRHHATIETLAAYSSGNLDEARSVVVGTHLDRCAKCRETVADFDAIGGACLDEIEPVAMKDDALKTFWKIADHTAPEGQAASLHADNDFRLEIAQPLNAYIKGGLDNVKWRPIAPGISQCVLDANGYRNGVMRLLRIAPGTGIPAHTHRGNELTLVLRGAYSDTMGTFQEGDIADLDGSHSHSPKAFGDQPCICLIATSAPLVFNNMVGKVIQPFIGM